MNPELKSILKSLGKDAGKGAWRYTKRKPKLLIILILAGIPLILISILFLPFLLLIGGTYYLMKFFKGKDVMINENVSVRPAHNPDKKSGNKHEDRYDKIKIAESVTDVNFKSK